MKATTKTLSILFAASLFAGACASSGPGDDDDDNMPQPDDAYLTVVGDSNVFMENGWEQVIEVRYHDGQDLPLAGEIEFFVVGDSNGGTISSSRAVTNADGIASVRVLAGAEGDAAFEIEAQAPYADSALWSIAVTGTEHTPPMDPIGRYDVSSEYDLVTGLPGTVGEVVNGFVEMTDDPNDPATFLLDVLVAEIDNGTIESLVNAARPFLDGALNDLLLTYAPDFVVTILDIGDKLGQVGREFGTVSTLEVVEADGIEGEQLAANHTVTGVTWTIDGLTYDYTMAELSMTNLVASDIAFRIENETRVYLGEHSFELSYGSMLLVALNEIIIPLVEPGADNLYELMDNLIDCYSVGTFLSEEIGFGSPGVYESACELGVTAAAGFLLDQLEDLDNNALVMTLAGDAKPQDTNADSLVDVLLGGEWTGDMSYAGTPAPLTEATFRADRQALP